MKSIDPTRSLAPALLNGSRRLPPLVTRAITIVRSVPKATGSCSDSNNPSNSACGGTR
jgi:hypothetical protein